MTRLMRFPSIAFTVAVTSLTVPALAQEHVVHAQAGVGTGLEGGDRGTGSVEWTRARTRLVLGADLSVDETPKEAWGIRGYVELEKRASVGAEARYTRWVSKPIGVFVGVTGTFAPETLFGAGAGATVLVPLGSNAALFIEPAFYALPLGSDVPDDSVVLWGLLAAGIRVGL